MRNLSKHLPKINLALKIAILASGAIFTLLHFISPEDYPKIWSYLSTIIVVFLPGILRSSRIKIDDSLEFAYYLFLIPAMVLGIDMDLYREIRPMDKVVHAASGVLSAFAAISFLRQATATHKNWFNTLFVLGFVALIAVLWECFEFSYDQITGGRMQQLHIPGLADTMWDMIVALIGGIVVIMFNFFQKPQPKTPQKDL